MKLALNIYKTKRDLQIAIRGAESFCIEFSDGSDFFIQSEDDKTSARQKEINIIQMDLTDGEGNTIKKFTHSERFIQAIWKRVKDYDRIQRIWIDKNEQDLNQMEVDAAINEAKAGLNKTQIKDNSIGMVSVTRPLHHKMTLIGDQTLIDLADAFGDLITDFNAADGFGVTKGMMDDMKSNKAKMMKAIKDMETAMKSMTTREQKRKLWGL